MAKPDVKKAKQHLSKIRQLVSTKKTPLSDMSEEEAIKAIRKTREELWDRKLATRT